MNGAFACFARKTPVPSAAVAAAYGWTDYTLEIPDADILKRSLALNLARPTQ